MDKLTFETGGFPLAVDRLRSMQDCWAQIDKALTAALLPTAWDYYGQSGNEDDYQYTQTDCFVVSGCGKITIENDTTAYFDGTTDGWIVVRGELLPFRHTTESGACYVVVKTETAENLDYQDGQNKTFRTSRYATLQLSPSPTRLTNQDFDVMHGRRSVSELVGAMQLMRDDFITRINRLTKNVNDTNKQQDANTRQVESDLEDTKEVLDKSIADLQTLLETSLAEVRHHTVPKGTIVETMWTLEDLTRLMPIEHIPYGWMPWIALPYAFNYVRANWEGYIDRFETASIKLLANYKFAFTFHDGEKEHTPKYSADSTDPLKLIKII